MIQGAFEKLELAQAATILDEVNPLLDGHDFDPVESTVLAVDLPFYPGYQLLDIANHSVSPPSQRFVLYKAGGIKILDFTNGPIYTMNRDLPIHLDNDNIAEYVRFFFAFVRGKHGRFLIVENVDDIDWREEPPPAARKAISAMITAIEPQENDAGAGYKMRACMVFKDSLFKSTVLVTPDGTVSLDDEELMIEDMPVMDDTFGQ